MSRKKTNNIGKALDWLKNKMTNLKDSSIGKATKVIKDTQDASKRGEFLVNKASQKKEEKKEEVVIDRKLAKNSVINKKTIDSTYDELVKHETTVLDKRQLVAMGLDPDNKLQSLIDYGITFGVIKLTSLLATLALSVTPISWLAAGAIALIRVKKILVAPIVPLINHAFKALGWTNSTWELTDIANQRKDIPILDSEYAKDDQGKKHYTAQSYVDMKKAKDHPYKSYYIGGTDHNPHIDEYNKEYLFRVKKEADELREKHGITDTNVNIFKAEYIANNKNLERFSESRKASQTGIDLSLDGDQVSISQQALQTVTNKPVATNDNTSDPNTWKKITNSLWKFPTAKFEETTVKGDSKAQTNTTKKKKARKSNQYVNISREELRAKYDACRAREIANDPSMEYFYSSKYQEETQFMYGGGGFSSNTNSLEANNFSSPARGSSDSNFNFSSNDNSPLKLDIPNVDDFIKDPKLIQVVQNIANNEAYKQLYEYNQENIQRFSRRVPSNCSR